MSSLTLAEAQEWGFTEVNNAIAIMRLDADDLYSLAGTDSHVRWGSDRDHILSHPEIGTCGIFDETPLPKKYSIGLMSVPLSQDPRPLVGAYREYLNDHGWETRDLDGQYDFVAEHSDGSSMSISGGTYPTGHRVSIRIYSACSPNIQPGQPTFAPPVSFTTSPTPAAQVLR